MKAIRQGCHRRWSSSRWGWKRCHTEACSYYMLCQFPPYCQGLVKGWRRAGHKASEVPAERGQQRMKKKQKEENGKCEAKRWWPVNYTWQPCSYVNRIWKYFCHIMLPLNNFPWRHLWNMVFYFPFLSMKPVIIEPVIKATFLCLTYKALL